MAKTVEIFLGMNVKKFVQAIKQAKSASKKLFDGLNAHKAQLRKVSLGTGIALGAEMLWLKKVTDAAGRQELAEIKLGAALKNVTGYREGDLKILTDQAAALQKITTYGDEQTISAQAMLATFQLNRKQIEQITPRLLDMAAAQEKLTGQSIDLNVIAQALGKGFTGQIGLLSRYGVQLTEVEKKNLSFNTLLGALDKRFKGIAEESAKGHIGMMKQLHNVMGDLDEELGSVFLPLISDITKKLIPLIVKAAEWVSRNKELVGILTGVGIGGTGLLFALSSMGYMLAGLPALFAAATGPIGIMVIGVIALAGAIVYFTMQGKQIPGTLEEIDAEIEANNKELDKLASNYDKAAKMSALFSGVTKGGLDPLTENVKRTQELKEHNERLTEAKRLLIEQQERENQARILANQLKQQTIDIAPEEEQSDKTKASNISDINLQLGEQKNKYQDIIDKMREFLELQKKLADETMDSGKKQRDELDAYIDKVQLVASMYVSNWSSAFDVIYAKQQKFLKSFGGAFVKAMLRLFHFQIEEYMAKIIAHKLYEIGKATMSAPLTFGATLAAIGPIVAAAAAAMAGLSALEAKMAKQKWFQKGGIVPMTGPIYAHAGEIVYNPRENTMNELGRWIAQSSPARTMAATTIGDTYLYPSYYGPLNTQIDINHAAKTLAESVRNALRGE